MTNRIAQVYLLAVVALRPTLAMASGAVVPLPGAGDVVIVPAARLPAVGDPDVARTLGHVAAADPDVAVAVPAPVARHPDVAHHGLGHRLIDHRGRRRDRQAYAD